MNLGPLPLTLSISSNASSIEPTDTRCFTPVLYREPSGKGRLRQLGCRAVKKVSEKVISPPWGWGVATTMPAAQRLLTVLR